MLALAFLVCLSVLANAPIVWMLRQPDRPELVPVAAPLVHEVPVYITDHIGLV